MFLITCVLRKNWLSNHCTVGLCFAECTFSASLSIGARKGFALHFSASNKDDVMEEELDSLNIYLFSRLAS